MDDFSDDDFLRSFEEYDCDDESIIVFGQVEETDCTNPISNTVNQLLFERAKYNKSYAECIDTSKQLNSVPGAKVKFPIVKQQIKRQANLKYSYFRYIFCHSCKILCKEGKTCENCNEIPKKTKSNYFIYIPLEQQIKNTLDRHINSILEHMNEQRRPGVLRDIYDSKIYKRVMADIDDQYILPFTINLDGAKIFNSSKTTLWPIQATQGFLPPNIRFLRENILIIGLYCGNEKPHMETIMLPFAEEMQRLQKNGIFLWNDGRLHNFIPKVLFCACDIPARAEMQNCKMPSGYYGCPCCQHIGIGVKNEKTKKTYVRFLKTEQPIQLRTHEHALRFGIDFLENGTSIEPKGLKGISCMVAFTNFDLVNGFPIDYMHGTLLGIVKLLMNIWLGKKRLHYEQSETFHFKPLNVTQRILLNRRIIALKPPTRIRHKPRPILDRGFYTANEYRNLLWYYLRFSLYGLLHPRLIKHFVLLSDATYILCKDNIKETEIHAAGTMLNEFADLFEKFYGKNSVTINLHLLRHYAHSVLNTGPLWCQSLFAFESNIGEIKRSFNSTVDVVEQIAFNFCIKAAIKQKPLDAMKIPEILRIKSKSIEQESILSLISVAMCSSIQTGQKYKIGYEMSWKKQVFKSINSTATKSIDHFVQLTDGTIGAIQFFIQFEKPYVLMEEYRIVKVKNHLLQIEPNKPEKYTIRAYDAIRSKLIYLKFDYSGVSFIEVVTIEPNPFEGS